jgi:DNA-binding response OmpR family regulator
MRCSGYSFGILVAFSHTATSIAESEVPKSEEHRQYLRVCVTHLRQKIESDPASPSLIKTEPGIGYRFISHEAF